MYGLTCGNLFLAALDDHGNGLCHLIHILGVQTSGSYRRGSQTDTTGHERRLGIVGDGVLVGGDVSCIQQLLHCLTGQTVRGQVYQHQMIVGTAGDNLNVTAHQALAQCLCVVHNVLLIYLKVVA